MKLLTYSSKKYLWLSSLLIVLSIPTFYLVVNSLFIHATDKTLENQAALIPTYIHEIKNPADLALWKKVDRDVEIGLFDKNNFSEKPFTIEATDPKTNGLEDFRHLQKQVEIFGIKHTITFKVSLVEKEDLIQSILVVQISLLLLIFLGFIIINRFISKKIWTPFHNILSFLKSYDLTKNIEMREEKLEIDEFNELNIDINNLLQRTQLAYQLQKEFTENAAHELQTPIAIIKSKLDLLLQEENLSKSQSALIDQIYYVLQKLTDLNKNLLFLTKIENQQFDFEDKIDCIKTVAEVIENSIFFAEAKYQQLLFPKPEPKSFDGNQALFDQLVQNLVINSVQYAPKGSIINILLTDRALTIVNEGPKLDFSEDKLFSRFSKTIEKNQKGNGLGLAISKKIALVHGFSMAYNYANAKHHFVINFVEQTKPEAT